MDNKRLSEIRQRSNLSTPGPWAVFKRRKNATTFFLTVLNRDGESMWTWPGFVKAKFEQDAEFIAHAWEDIPWLIEQIGQLQEAIAKAKGKIERISVADEEHERFYYCVEVGNDLSRTGDIYVWADYVTVTDCGALLFLEQGEKNIPLLAFAPGQWLAFYVASAPEGSPVAAEHWREEQ